MAAQGLVILAVLATVSAASAASSQLTDPTGDARYNAPAYVDIVSAAVEQNGGTISFTMSVAAPVPAAVSLPPQANKEIRWTWPIDADPTTFPAGWPYPDAPGQVATAEFFAYVVWDGTSFSASLTDRTPLLSGGTALVTPLSFTISGTDLTVDIPRALLPNQFSWGALTFYWSSREGTKGGHFVDRLDPFYNPFAEG